MQKKSIRGLALISILAGLALVGAACGSSSSSSSGGTTAAGGQAAGGDETESSTKEVASVPFTGMEAKLPKTVSKPKPGNVKIAFLSPLEANETVHYRTATVEAAVEELGGTVGVYDAKVEPDAQVSQGEQAIAAGAEAIIIEPVDPGAVKPILNQAKAAGIPVVGVDVNLESPDLPAGYSGQVLTGRDIRSYTQAKTAAELLEPGANVGIIGFAVPVPSVERTVEQEKIWSQKFGLNVVGETQNPTDEIAGGERAMTEMISQYPEVEGVIAYNDNSAVGGAAAARAAGKTDLVLIGNNGEQIGIGAVAEGRISATVQGADVEAGKQLAWMAVDLVQGAKIPQSVFAGEALAVTSENVDEVESWAETLKKEFNP